MTTLGNDAGSTKLRRAFAINGACIVLAIIGLALISNRLLDRADVANEQGLSIEERKEKTRLNDADYGKEYSRTSFNPLAWFSKPTADKMCDDNKIVSTALSLIKENTPDFAKLGLMAGKLEAMRLGQPDNTKQLESKMVPNEIKIVSEPLPSQYDESLNRAVCQISYSVKGLGYPANTRMTATYLIQSGQKDWAVNLIAVK